MIKAEKYIFYTVLFLFIFSLSLIFNNVDMDFWARVMQGDAVLQTGSVLYDDPFSYIPAHSWIDHEWGSGVVFAFIQNTFGITGQIILKTLMIFGILFFIAKIADLQENKSTKIYNILFYIMTFYGLQTLWINGIRCHLFTFLFFTVFLYLLELVRKRQKDKLLKLLPVIMLFWCNVHGGCVSGIGLLFMYALGEALNKKPFGKYLVTAVFCLLTFFINPYGLDYIHFLLSATTMKRTGINEWNSLFSTGFYTLFTVKLFVLGTIIMTVATLFRNLKNKIDYTKYIVVYIVTILGLLYIKQSPFVVICGAAFFYHEFYAFVNYLFFRIFKTTYSVNFIKAKEILIYLFLFIISGLSVITADFKVKNMAYYPYKAVEFIKNNNLNGKLLNEFGLGSYLAYKLYPQMLIFIDGRYEEVYYNWSVNLGDDFYIPTDNWKKTLNLSGGADYVLVRKDFMAYDNMLYNAPKYTEIYSDERFALFCKNYLLKHRYLLKRPDFNYYNKVFFDKTYSFSK